MKDTDLSTGCPSSHADEERLPVVALIPGPVTCLCVAVACHASSAELRPWGAGAVEGAGADEADEAAGGAGAACALLPLDDVFYDEDGGNERTRDHVDVTTIWCKAADFTEIN